MRIGINSLFLVPNKHGGTEHYVRNLLESLSQIDRENQYFIFTNSENAGTFNIAQDNFSEVKCGFSARYKPLRVLWEQTILPFYVSRYKLDVLFSPVYVSPMLKLSNCRYVVVIHDMMSRRYPENYPKAQLIYLRTLLLLSARKADRIITVSENTKGDIVNFLRVPEEKISVIYTSGLPDEKHARIDNKQLIETIRKKYNLEDNFILCVATFNPQKNIEGLLRAFYLLKNRYRLNHQLILTGMVLRQGSKMTNLIDKLKLNGSVKITGYIPDEDLQCLYCLAGLFVLPSFFEGLGVTPLEAMVCGCPVATSDIAPIREVVGDAAALFCPYDVQQMADVINKTLCDEEFKKTLIQKGLQRAAQFSWRKTAIETLKLFEQVSRESIC